MCVFCAVTLILDIFNIKNKLFISLKLTFYNKVSITVTNVSEENSCCLCSYSAKKETYLKIILPNICISILKE